MDWKALLDIIISLFKKIKFDLKFTLSFVPSIFLFIFLRSKIAIMDYLINLHIKMDDLTSALLAICLFVSINCIIFQYRKNKIWRNINPEEEEFIKKHYSNKSIAKIRCFESFDNYREIVQSLERKGILYSEDLYAEPVSIIIKDEPRLYFSKKFKPSIFSRIKSFISNGCCSKDKK